MLTHVVQGHFFQLGNGRSAYWRLQYLLAFVGAWLLVPVTIWWFWFRYMPIGDVRGTIVHHMAIAGVIWFGVNTYSLMYLSFQNPSALGKASTPMRVLFRWNRCASIRWPLAILLIIAAVYGCHRLREFAFMERPAWARLDLSYAELSQKLPGCDDTQVDRDKMLRTVRGADLEGRDFKNAKLQGAFLVGANLPGADFQDASLLEADLRGALLHKADLRGALLGEADLRGADLKDVNLQCADLRGIDEKHPTDLGTAKNLTREQVDQACCNEWTKLPAGLSKDRCSKNCRDVDIQRRKSQVR